MVDKNPNAAKTCWVLTEGHAGMEGQCVGLAEKLGFNPIIRRVSIKPLWKYLPARFWPNPVSMASPETPLMPPWPDILISCGRRSAAAAAQIKRLNPQTLAIHIQVPPLPAKSYDTVIVPEHDALRGPNVLVMRGSLHKLTEEKLLTAKKQFAPAFAQYSSPRIGVLVGGSTKRQKFSAKLAQDLAQKLKTAGASIQGASILLTPSRRTGEENIKILSGALAGPRTFIWDGTGENPYFGILALADYLIVTSDSANMISEACFTGKPVLIFDLPGGSKRLRRFHEKLVEDGYARMFNGTLEPFNPPRLDEMTEIAKNLRRKYNL